MLPQNTGRKWPVKIVTVNDWNLGYAIHQGCLDNNYSQDDKNCNNTENDKKKLTILYIIISGSLAAKVARQDSLARFLSNRPSRQELEAKNIIPNKSEDEIHQDRQAIGSKLIR